MSQQNDTAYSDTSPQDRDDALILTGGRAGWMPRWLMGLGVGIGLLYALSMFSYSLPALTFTQAGAPLGVLWILITGIALLRRRGRMTAAMTVKASRQPA
jgi:hypothetical protein